MQNILLQTQTMTTTKIALKFWIFIVCNCILDPVINFDFLSIYISKSIDKSWIFKKFFLTYWDSLKLSISDLEKLLKNITYISPNNLLIHHGSNVYNESLRITWESHLSVRFSGTTKMYQHKKKRSYWGEFMIPALSIK